MAGNQGTQDWFYHAPTKKNDGDGPVDYPAPSQIPLSSFVMVDDREDDTGMKRGWIRDTDSKYVKMAKMGGRKDLLKFREPRTTPTEAKPYPRVEWFDHEEAQPADENETTGPRQIFLPEYMVHEEYNPEGHDNEDADRPPLRRPPFSLQDKLTAFQRDGDSVTDKTVRIPEEKPFQRKQVMTKKDKQLKAATRQSANQRKSSQQSQRYATVEPPQHDKANISKLLSMGYQMDWYNDREKYYGEQKKLQEKQPKWEVTKTEPKSSTEYRDYISKQEMSKELQAKPKQKKTTNQAGGRASRERRGSLDDNKLFKLSKFEKASPKVDTHWSAGKERQSNPMDSYTQQLQMDIS